MSHTEDDVKQKTQAKKNSCFLFTRKQNSRVFQTHRVPVTKKICLDERADRGERAMFVKIPMYVWTRPYLMPYLLQLPRSLVLLLFSCCFLLCCFLLFVLTVSSPTSSPALLYWILSGLQLTIQQQENTSLRTASVLTSDSIYENTLCIMSNDPQQ